MEEKKVEKVEKVVPIRQGENAISTNYVQVASPKKPSSPMVKGIRQSVIWFNIFTAMVCAVISLMNIWLDNSLGDVMGKAWATFFVLGAFSLFIMAIAPLLDRE